MIWPSVSVVVPVRDELESIGPAIASALDQDYEHPIEVVVADGASTDGTWELLQQMESADSRIVAVSSPAGITPAGLNAAIRASTGEVIVRLDGHAILPPGYIRQAVETMIRESADNVGGVQAAVGSGLVQEATAMAMSSPVGVGDARFHYGGEAGPVDTVYLGVFKRDVFDRVGLFDESLLRNQDYELNYRIRAAGGIVWFDPLLRVEYRPRSSLKALWRQYFQYGAWKREVLSRHRKSLRWRQLVPPVFVLALIVSIILLATPVPALGTIVPAAYAALLIGTAAIELVRSGNRAAMMLPVVLSIMHIAWGVGFLIGGRARIQSSKER